MKTTKLFLLLFGMIAFVLSSTSCDKDEKNLNTPPEYKTYFPEKPAGLLPPETYLGTEWKSTLRWGINSPDPKWITDQGGYIIKFHDKPGREFAYTSAVEMGAYKFSNGSEHLLYFYKNYGYFSGDNHWYFYPVSEDVIILQSTRILAIDFIKFEKIKK